MEYTKEKYQKDVRHYGTLCSLPLIASIVHLLFTVFFITTVSFHEADKTLGNLYVLGEMFSVSSFSCVLLGANLTSFSAFKAIPSLVGIGFGLIEIFLSTFAVKGDKKSYFISFLLYGLDTLFIIPTIILSFTLKTASPLQIYDIILMIFLHLVFLSFFFYGLKISRRIKNFEEQKALQENEIHIKKGNEK